MGQAGSSPIALSHIFSSQYEDKYIVGNKRTHLPTKHASAYVSIRQHTSAYAYVSIRQHTSAYVSIRQHTSAYVLALGRSRPGSIRQHTSAYVSIAHTPVDQRSLPVVFVAYVSIRQHTSAEEDTHLSTNAAFPSLSNAIASSSIISCVFSRCQYVYFCTSKASKLSATYPAPLPGASCLCFL